MDMEITADESNTELLDVVGDSLPGTSVNAYGSPVASARSRRNEIGNEATETNVAVLNRVVSFDRFYFYFSGSYTWGIRRQQKVYVV